MSRTILARLLARAFAPSVYLFDGTPAAGAAPAAPAAGGEGAAPSSSAPAPSSLASPAPAAGGGSAWSAPKDKAEFDAALETARNEGRRGFVPSHRLREETTARQNFERDLATANARIRALAGLENASPDQQEKEKVRNAFFEMFPEMRGLATLTPEKIAKIDAVLSSGDDAGAVVKQHWDNHANGVYTRLATSIEETLGVDKFTDRQFNGMVTAFRGWSRDQAQADPQKFQRRYESGDPTLLEEFIKQFTEDWIAPSRRQAQTQFITRPRVPSGGRTPAITTPPPNMDNIKNPEDAEAAGIEYMRGRGVGFSGG